MDNLLASTQFFGRFHPLIVHLPIGFLVVLAVTSVCFRRAKVKAPERVLLVMVVLSSAIAAVFGWLLASDGGYDADILFRHRWLGIGVAIGCAVCLILHAINRFKLYGLALAVTFGGVGLVGHDGGSLTHGSDYLFQHMPNSLRTLLGMEPLINTPSLVITDVSNAPVYEAIVYPIFQNNCISCHGASKSRGDLRMDTPEGILTGGKEGPLVLVEDPTQSPLLTRIHLPIDDKEHMPPAGKPQLTADQKTVLAWWVEAGTPFEGTVEEIDPTINTHVMLESYLGLIEPSPEPLPLAEVASEAERLARELNIRIEPIADGRNELELSVQNVASTFGDEQLKQLNPLAANLVALNLGGSQITDAGLSAIRDMANMQKLWLDRTAITDAGLTNLAGLRQLHYLNLYGTAISDSGLVHLERAPSLKQIYLWQTHVTPEAAATFTERSIDAVQLNAWRKEVASKQKLIDQAGTRVELGLDVKDQREKTDSTPKDKVKTALDIHAN